MNKTATPIGRQEFQGWQPTAASLQTRTKVTPALTQQCTNDTACFKCPIDVWAFILIISQGQYNQGLSFAIMQPVV